MTASFLTSPSYDFNFNYNFLFEKKVKKWYKAAPRRQNPEAMKLNNKYKLKRYSKPLPVEP